MSFFRDGDCPPLNRWSEPLQIVGLTVVALSVNIIIGIAIIPLGLTDSVEFKTEIHQKFGMYGALLIGAIVAPFIETIIGQWLPLFMARLAKRKPPYPILWAAVWFSLLHFGNGIAHVIQNFGVGWVLASSFVFWRQESWIKAYRATSIIHALHNTIIFILFFLLH